MRRAIASLLAIGVLSLSAALGFNPGRFACANLLVTKVDYMTPSGVETSSPDPSYATLYHYDNGAQQEIDPKGFNPLTASDETLEAFGFPPRPTDPAALKDWNNDYRNYKGSAGPGMCESNVYSQIGFTSAPQP